MVCFQNDIYVWSPEKVWEIQVWCVDSPPNFFLKNPRCKPKSKFGAWIILQKILKNRRFKLKLFFKKILKNLRFDPSPKSKFGARIIIQKKKNLKIHVSGFKCPLKQFLKSTIWPFLDGLQNMVYKNIVLTFDGPTGINLNSPRISFKNILLKKSSFFARGVSKKPSLGRYFWLQLSLSKNFQKIPIQSFNNHWKHILQ